MKIREIKEYSIQDVEKLIILGNNAIKDSDCIGHVKKSMIKEFMDIISSIPYIGVILLAEVDEEPVGVICAVKSSNYIFETKTISTFHFYVDPEHRNSKIPLKLMRQYEKWAKDNEYEKLVMTLPVDKETKSFIRSGYQITDCVMEKEI